MHSENSYITLTYSNQHLPADYSVAVRPLQLFMKRLRKHYTGKTIRFFACGEYGDDNLRPHYHALLFGHQFGDLKLWKKNQKSSELDLYTSETLTRLWGLGHCTVGRVTFQSARYVSGYVTKKISGEKADQHYMRRHPLTGDWHQVTPEFLVQSRRPGIGASWFDKFKSDVFPSDFIIADGKKINVPRYYTGKLEEEARQQIQRQRKQKSLKRKEDNTPARLAVREEIAQRKLQLLPRKLKSEPDEEQ